MAFDKGFTRKFWEMNLLGTRAQLSHYCIQCILQWKNLWFNAAFHEGTFQNCNFHVVNNFSKYESE